MVQLHVPVTGSRARIRLRRSGGTVVSAQFLDWGRHPVVQGVGLIYRLYVYGIVRIHISHNPGRCKPPRRVHIGADQQVVRVGSVLILDVYDGTLRAVAIQRQHTRERHHITVGGPGRDIIQRQGATILYHTHSLSICLAGGIPTGTFELCVNVKVHFYDCGFGSPRYKIPA